MGFADEPGPVTGLPEIFAYRVPVFQQFGAKRPRAVLARVHAGNDRSAAGRAGRIGAIRPVKRRSFPDKPVQVRGLYFGIPRANRVPMLLIAGDQQNVRFFHPSPSLP